MPGTRTGHRRAHDHPVKDLLRGDDHDTLQDIADNPENYYIDLHSDNGCLRVQLAYG